MSISHGFTQLYPPSEIFKYASIDAEHYGPDALRSFAEVFAVNAVDPDRDEVFRFIATEQLRAVHGALVRWERMSRITEGIPSPADRRYEQWRVLTQLCRERVEISDVFHAGGYRLTYVGRNGRRQCPEWSGPCPACNTGDDRLRVWDDGAAGRAWCRVCSWSADHVSVAMALRQCTFREAVTWLAALAGTATPEAA